MKSALQPTKTVKNDEVVRSYNEHRGTVKDTRLEDTFNYNKVLDGAGLEEMVKALMENEYGELLRNIDGRAKDSSSGSF